jgi:3-hydroxyacyl-[acyl-carrier-protein] dehydratase
MDINAVMAVLPHRPPMLMIDRVLVCEPGKQLRAIKNVTMNEPWLSGHFPGFPLFPGVMVIEALAQAAAILAHNTAGTRAVGNSLLFFAGIDHARFRRQVVPGDQLILEVEVLRIVRGVGKFATRARVGDEIVAEAELLAALRAANMGAANTGAANTGA